MIISSGGNELWGWVARPSPGAAAARLAANAARPSIATPVQPVDNSPRVRPGTREEVLTPVADRAPSDTLATATGIDADRVGSRFRRIPPVGVPLADTADGADPRRRLPAVTIDQVAEPVRGGRVRTPPSLPTPVANVPQPPQFAAASDAYQSTWDRSFTLPNLVDFST